MARFRALAATAATLLLTALVVATPAPNSTAASRVLAYECSTSGVTMESPVVVTASWDTGIPDGLVVDVGDKVGLEPITGTITFPAEYVDALRLAGFADLAGYGGATLAVTENGVEYLPVLMPKPTPLPGSGPVALPVEGVIDGPPSGTTDPVTVREAGWNTLVANHFGIIFGDFLGPPGSWAQIICQLSDTQRTTVDRFFARAVTPTTPPPPTAVATGAAVRPALVQTDAAQPGPSALPLVALGVGGLALGGLAAVLERRFRRH